MAFLNEKICSGLYAIKHSELSFVIKVLFKYIIIICLIDKWSIVKQLKTPIFQPVFDVLSSLTIK